MRITFSACLLFIANTINAQSSRFLPFDSITTISYRFDDDRQPQAITTGCRNGHLIWGGDMVLGPIPHKKSDAEGLVARGVAHWPGAFVPYQISPNLPAWQQDEVTAVLENLTARTNVCFAPRKGEALYLKFEVTDQAGTSYANLGMSTGDNLIRLDNYAGGSTITHEVMHALGVLHEHQRADRNSYVLVNYNCLPLQYQGNLALLDTFSAQMVGPYDYASTMNYGENCLTPLVPGVKIGPLANGYQYMSPQDIETINFLYPLPCSVAPAAYFTFASEGPQFCEGTVVHFTADCRAYNGSDYYWSFPGGQPSFSTAAEPLIVYPDQGLYHATLTIPGSDPVTTTFTKELIIKGSQFGAEVWQSVARTRVKLYVQGKPGGTITVRVFDMSGRVVQTAILEHLSCDNLIDFEIRELPCGLYWVELSDGAKSYAQKIAVMR